MLEEAGVTVLPSSTANRIRLGGPEASVDFEVIHRDRAPYPGEALRLSRTDGAPLPLLIAPHVPPATGRALRSAGWSWVDASGQASIRGPGLLIEREVMPSVAAVPSARRQAPATFAVMRLLIVSPEPLTQRAFAVAASATQPLVSRVLRGLASDGLVERTGDGWAATDHRAMLARFMDGYPGPGGLEIGWYGLDSPSEQVAAVMSAARWRCAVSGDVAADLIAPWRVPSAGLVYTDPAVDPAVAGLVPTDVIEAATLVQRIPADWSVFGPHMAGRSLFRQPVEVAHPTQVVLDLLAAGGEDRAEAAERVLKKVLG
jgi:hypothetical protein